MTDRQAPLRLPRGETFEPWQPDDIRAILKVWRDGALVGKGSALGPILATSMGLGKCLEVIVAANTYGMRRVLVVAPKAAITDWIKNLRRFTEGVFWYDMRTRKRWTDVQRGWVLINYEKVGKWQQLRQQPWDLLVFDESQYVKEKLAKRTQRTIGGDGHAPIPCKKAIFVSGTPLKNRIEELYPALHFLDASQWAATEDEFKDEYYAGAYLKNSKDHVIQNVAHKNLRQLHEKLRRTILVRTNKEQAGIAAKKVYELLLVPPDKLSYAEWMSLVDYEDTITYKRWKLRRLQKQLRQLGAHSHRRYLLSEIAELEAQIQGLEAERHHEVAVRKQESILKYLLTLKEKTVVLCYHKQDMLYYLARGLRAAGRHVVTHSGDNNSPDEANKVFQDNPNVQFFIGQHLAASLSLTLTAAHHVVFAELPLTRSDFNQGEDRTHRIPQKHPTVTVTICALDVNVAGETSQLDYFARSQTMFDLVMDGIETAPVWNWQARKEILESGATKAIDAAYVKRGRETISAFQDEALDKLTTQLVTLLRQYVDGVKSIIQP